MKFHYIARGIIFENNKVLLVRQKGADNTFLPGGHIEIGEKAELALCREIAEEMGHKAFVKRFIGAVECVWAENNRENHEINLVFEVGVPALDTRVSPPSQETHLEFIWAEPSELRTYNLQPYPLIECLINWESGYRGYWGSAFGE
jgi:8-oxo-dGTP pyrophosphatase MutT (NUDIX family)